MIFCFVKVIRLLSEPGARMHFLTDIGVPVMAYSDRFVAYNDEDSVRLKVNSYKSIICN